MEEHSADVSIDSLSQNQNLTSAGAWQTAAELLNAPIHYEQRTTMSSPVYKAEAEPQEIHQSEDQSKRTSKSRKFRNLVGDRFAEDPVVICTEPAVPRETRLPVARLSKIPKRWARTRFSYRNFEMNDQVLSNFAESHAN